MSMRGLAGVWVGGSFGGNRWSVGTTGRGGLIRPPVELGEEDRAEVEGGMRCQKPGGTATPECPPSTGAVPSLDACHKHTTPNCLILCLVGSEGTQHRPRLRKELKGEDNRIERSASPTHNPIFPSMQKFEGNKKIGNYSEAELRLL
jgi:hypothetical protein